uniref:BK_channel_a domain-containing protein n=2 Tax=Caenorhabditis tropicalis TaxID=1561998 RepID=A0A1I7U4G8_9PELO
MGEIYSPSQSKGFNQPYGYPMNCNLSRVFMEMTEEDRKCLEERKYWCFLLSSITTFCASMILVVIWRVVTHLCCQRREREFPPDPIPPPEAVTVNMNGSKHAGGEGDPFLKQQQEEKHLGWMTEAKDWAGELISGQSLTGRFLVLLVFILSIGSLIIYFYDASFQNFQVETCIPWQDSPSQQIDLGFNIFFLVYFFIRFIAASDKVWFLLEMYSWIDFFTIPPSFVAIYLQRNWLGEFLEKKVNRISTISHLAPVAFAGLSHIDHLWFRNSRIDVIAMEAFHYLTNIDYIYFHKTKIGRIERKAFSKMYQIDHFYFKDSIEIEMIESEAFSGSQIDELIMDGVTVESAHDTFLLNTDAENVILKNCSIYLVPRKDNKSIEFEEDQKIIEKCLIDSSTFNIISPYKLGCNVLEVASSSIQRIGPVSRDIDIPVFRPEPSISSSLNSISFSNCSIGSVDSFAFTNYSLSILSFNHSKIDNFQTNSIEKSRIKRLELGNSKIKTINESCIHKSIIKNILLDGLDLEDLNSGWINSSRIGNLRILNSKIEMIDGNIFKNSEFDEVEVDGNRVMIMDSEAFFGENKQ